MAEMSELCKVGQACLAGEEVFYPGSTFFIDPAGMTPCQLLFIFGVYGYVLFVSADMIGDGAELLLLVPAYSDMVGSIVLPILGAIPDGMIVLFSGIGPLAVAQENVAVGVGGLAGSTIMLLTLPWLLSVQAAQVDMNASGECVGYKQGAGKRFTPGKEHGCRFEDGVTKNAWLMLLTSLTYFVIQIPAFYVDDQKTTDEYDSKKDWLAAVVKESKFENFWAGIGALVTLVFFLFYMLLQYLAATKANAPGFLKSWLPDAPAPVGDHLVQQFGLLPMIENYRNNYNSTGRMSAGQVEVTYEDAFLGARLPTDLAAPLGKLFTKFANQTVENGLHQEDMRQLLSTVGLCYSPSDFAVKFKKADADQGGFLDKMEFMSFFYSMVTGPDPLPYQVAQPPVESSGGGDGDEDEDEIPDEFKDLSPEEQQKAIIRLSVKQMLIGTVLVLVFSDPMVDILAQIGVATGIPTFYVSFVLAPLASNASELLSSMKLAAKKTTGSLTQSLQTLEGAACMNNTFCLGIFLFLIYYQGLAWKFTAETLSIFLVQFLVFVIVIKSNVQTMKSGWIIFSMYPVSLVFVAALEAYGLD